MRKLIPTSVITTALIAVAATAAWAQDDTNVGTSSAEETTVSHGNLKDEVAGIKPEVAILSFQDSEGASTTRGAIGLHYDLNMSNIVAGASENLYFGPSFGGLYSHIGSNGADFFGTSPSINDGTAAANLVEIPLDLKLGYNFFDNLRVSAHGGGTLLYRSVASAVQLDTTTSQSSNWKIYPAVGGDLEFGLTHNIAIDLRPDFTLTPINTLFTGALGIGFALG
jgi:hypothetical protein